MLSLLSWSVLYSQTIHFTDVTAAKQVQGLWVNNCYMLAHGIAFADINNDGLADFYVSNAAEGKISYPDLLYLSHSNAAFTQEATLRGLQDNYGIGSHGVIFFDLDNDGDYDLFNGNTTQKPYVYAFDRLYRNNGSGVFSDITISAGLQQNYYATRGAVVFDANNDGYMDLLSVGSEITTYMAEPYRLYLNQGNSTFQLTDMGLASLGTDGLSSQSVTVVDYNNDGKQEVFIPRVDRWNKPPVIKGNQLLVLGSDGLYHDHAAALGLLGWGWSDGGTFADYDNDGDLDLFVAGSYSKSTSKILVYNNRGKGAFQNITDQVNIYQRGYSTLLFDVDNDADLDLYAISNYAAGDAIGLYLNDGHGHFSRLDNSGLEVSLFDPRGAAVADVDNDGDLDVYICDANKTGGPAYSNHLLRNDLSGSNRWLKIHGKGPKGDMGGFGTKVWIFQKGHMEDMAFLLGYRQIITAYAYMGQDEPVLHLGLASHDSVDVKITLIDGATFRDYSVPAGIRLWFNKPKSISVFSGNQQSGIAGQALAQPLCVKLVDENNVPIMGAPVVFTNTVGAGSIIEAQPVYSNRQGVARVHYRLGAGSVDNKIITSSSMLSQQVEFIAHVQSAQEVKCSVKVYLQGAVNPNLFDLLPFKSPYSEDVVTVSTKPINAVDWILLQLRLSNGRTIVKNRSLFLLNNGYLADETGNTNISLSGIIDGAYYIVLKHRNHMAIMSRTSIQFSKDQNVVYDFTTSMNKAYGYRPMVQMPSGAWAMWAGDANLDGVITALDFTLLANARSQRKSGYVLTDITLDGVVNQEDIDLLWNNAKEAPVKQAP